MTSSEDVKRPTPSTDATLGSLEVDRFQLDRHIRLEELELKRAESRRLADELKFRQDEATRSRWANPFVVAIGGAIVVGLANLVVTSLNAKYQRELAESTNANQGYLESIKSENTSILEAVKLGDSEKVRVALCLLLKLNSIKSSATNTAVQMYVAGHKGCETDATSAPQSSWQIAKMGIPGCGTSGCYETFAVCGPVPKKTRATGNTRNAVDSFGGAWGDWTGPPLVSETQVCRSFTQHSHNVTRTVSFEFEVVPAS
jgi:hypothetical protein